MPNYQYLPGTATQPNPPSVIYQGDSYLLFNAETVAAPQASVEVGLGGKYDNYPSNVSVEVIFSADPGVFEIDIQEADTDGDVYFTEVPSAGAITAVSAGFVARSDLVPIKAKFMRVYVKTLTNAVKTTVKVTR